MHGNNYFADTIFTIHVSVGGNSVIGNGDAVLSGIAGGACRGVEDAGVLTENSALNPLNTT